jgi:hypothetical protein
MTAAQPQTACYDGRLLIGGFNHPGRANYALVGANGKKIGNATSRKGAVAAICAAAKKATPTKH